jgi:hypothetical protein
MQIEPFYAILNPVIYVLSGCALIFVIVCKWLIFKKNVFHMINAFSFSLQIFSANVFHIRKKSEISYNIYSEVFSKCVWYSVQFYYPTLSFLDILDSTFTSQIFTKLHPVATELFHTNLQTVGQSNGTVKIKLIDDFRNFVKASKNSIPLLTTIFKTISKHLFPFIKILIYS